jgi:hypothetical protein
MLLPLAVPVHSTELIIVIDIRICPWRTDGAIGENE